MSADEYSPEYPLRTPYAKGTLNQTRSQLVTKTAKPAQTRMFTLLIARGYKAHDEHPVHTDIYDEEWNDFKVYHMDIFVEPNIDLELDGEVHRSAYRMRKDEKRDAWLTAHGFKVLRFDNAFALRHPERVLATLDEAGAEKWA